jgi:hypothetical protein
VDSFEVVQEAIIAERPAGGGGFADALEHGSVL